MLIVLSKYGHLIHHSSDPDDFHLIVNDAEYAYLLGPNSIQNVLWTTNKIITIYPTYSKSELYPTSLPTVQPTNLPSFNPADPCMYIVLFLQKRFVYHQIYSATRSEYKILEIH